MKGESEVQSHDSEFRERGEVVPSLTGNYGTDALDEIHKQLVAHSDDTAVSLETRLRDAEAEYRLVLAETRDYARMHAPKPF